MFDFVLFFWELLVSIFSIITDNPWLAIWGKILIYIIRKFFDNDNPKN